MKRKFSLAGLVCLLVAVPFVAGPAAQASAATPKVFCFAANLKKPAKAKVKPTYCRISTDTSSPNLTSMFQFSKASWSKWSRTVAVGRGFYATQSNKPLAAVLRLSNPRRVCGRTVFTTAQYRIVGSSKGWSPSFAILPCKR